MLLIWLRSVERRSDQDELCAATLLGDRLKTQAQAFDSTGIDLVQATDFYAVDRNLLDLYFEHPLAVLRLYIDYCEGGVEALPIRFDAESIRSTK